MIGADFLHNFNLMDNVRHKKLVDKITNLSTIGNKSQRIVNSIKTYKIELTFSDIIHIILIYTIFDI
jgi:hypothetical protein